MPQNLTETAPSAVQRARGAVHQMNQRRPKPISTSAHGVLDYTLSPTLTFAPESFGFPEEGVASMVPRVVGATAIGYSALTRYELGVLPVVPMKAHLVLDAVSGMFLAASPWMFGFGKTNKPRTWVPHLAFALTEMAIVAFSDDRSTR